MGNLRMKDTSKLERVFQANIVKEIKTIFLTTRPKYNFISSSSVKEVFDFGGDISKFVPEVVNEYLKEKFKK